MTIVDYPEKIAYRSAAALDPLTPVSILRNLYAEGTYQLTSCLARNSALPLDIIADMLANKAEGSDWLLLNPSTTFDQALYITKLTYPENEVIESCKTVIELFDSLISMEDERPSLAWFLALVLRSPLVSEKEFKERAEFYEEELNHWLLFADSRFDVNSMDITLVEGSSDLEAISKNPNASSGLLAEIIALMPNLDRLFDAPFYNPNCPVPLAAAHFAETMEEHKWSPSILKNFEPRLDAYMGAAFGYGPWESLPLSWKLKMVVG